MANLQRIGWLVVAHYSWGKYFKWKMFHNLYLAISGVANLWWIAPWFPGMTFFLENSLVSLWNFEAFHLRRRYELGLNKIGGSGKKVGHPCVKYWFDFDILQIYVIIGAYALIVSSSGAWYAKGWPPLI